MSASGKIKVFLMENVERMNISSSNAFLKILEEPPQNTVIIMTCTDPFFIPNTIVSRSRHVKLFPPKKIDCILFMKKIYPNESEEKISDIYELSLTKLGKALRLLEDQDLQEKYFRMREQLIDLFKEYFINERFAFVEGLLADKVDAKKNIAVFYEVLTYLMRKDLFSDDDTKKKHGLKILSKISRDGILLKRNVNAKLILENLMLLI
jgi:DNA polymerase III delta prime subunit